MRNLPTFLRDTKNALQLIEEKNEEGIPKNANFLTADIEAMYPNMPMDQCEIGIREYLDGRPPKAGKPSTDNVIKCLKICQQNNIFEFMGKLYRQTKGSAIGQKQAPAVACLGAGILERKALSTPRSLVYNQPSGRILSKDANDPAFWSVRDLVDWYKRFIDDILCLFNGSEAQAAWLINIFNQICPGQVRFTYEFSEYSTIFLNLKLILNRDADKIDIDYYVKPTNNQLFLHFRSCHPKHVFKAIVFNQALLPTMVCSYPEWRDRYLQNLRTKFIEQEYPEELVDTQFERAKKLNRNELIRKKKVPKKNEKNKFRMKNCLCITLNPGNPPFRKWLKDLTPILHRDPSLRKMIPDIPVVYRQPPSVAKIAVKAKHWKGSTTDNNQPGGSCRQHLPNRCVCCNKMEESKEKFTSTRTGREYKIRRTYTCTSRWVIYLVTCTDCNIQYVGQTTQEMRQRHYGHRSDIKSGTAGLGSHFNEVHGNGLDLKIKENLEACMESFSLTIVASVRAPANPEEQESCQTRLDRLEGDLQHRLRCMDEHGGLNIRDENTRRSSQ